MERSHIFWKAPFLMRIYFAMIGPRLGWIVTSKLSFSQNIRCTNYLLEKRNIIICVIHSINCKRNWMKLLKMYLLRISTNKINNPSKNSKFYCSHLQTLLNSKKTPIIQLVFHNNRYMADSKGKSELFNFFFSER